MFGPVIVFSSFLVYIFVSKGEKLLLYHGLLYLITSSTTIRQVSTTLLVISEGLTKLFIRIIRQHSKNDVIL